MLNKYSFKNLSIYRKIAYLLLEILITKNKEKFHSESTKVIICFYAINQEKVISKN